MSGVSYLQKPIDATALTIALEPIQEAPKAAQKAIALEHLRQSLAHNYEAQTICLSGPEGEVHLPLHPIIRVQATGEAPPRIFLVGGTEYVVAGSLRILESLLTPSGFFRTHPDHLINTLHAAEFLEGERLFVKMQEGSPVPVSPRKKDALRALLKK